MIKGLIIKSTAVAIMMLAGSAAQAQEGAGKDKASCSVTCNKGEGMKKKAFMESLSDEQKVSYKKLKESRKADKEALHATFSPEQLAIVENKELDKKAKHEALKGTFTDAQKSKKKANKEAHKSAKEAFVATLSEEQKALMPKEHHGKKGHKKEKK